MTNEELVRRYKIDLSEKIYSWRKYRYLLRRFFVDKLLPSLNLENQHGSGTVLDEHRKFEKTWTMDRWPKDLSFIAEVDGVWFRLYRSGEKGLLRLYVDCPICEKHLPFGRISQHMHRVSCEKERQKNERQH